MNMRRPRGKQVWTLLFTDVKRDNKQIYDALATVVREIGLEPPTYKKVCDWGPPWGMFKHPSLPLRFSIEGFDQSMGLESFAIKDGSSPVAYLRIESPFSDHAIEDALTVVTAFSAAVEFRNGKSRYDWKGHFLITSVRHQFYDENGEEIYRNNEKEGIRYGTMPSDFSSPACCLNLCEFIKGQHLLSCDDYYLNQISFIHHQQLAIWFDIAEVGEARRQAIEQRLSAIPLQGQEQIIPMDYGVIFVAGREPVDEITEFHLTRAFFAKVRGIPLIPRRIVRRDQAVTP